MPESPDAFSEAFAALTRAQVSAVRVHANPFLLLHRATIAALALEHRLPTIMEDRRYAQAGGLMSYGPNVLDIFRRVATYVDKILKGANPADLPVEQPIAFELNRTTRHWYTRIPEAPVRPAFQRTSLYQSYVD